MKEIAQLMGIGYTYLHGMMNGDKSSMTMQTCYKICDFYKDYSLCDILDYPRPDDSIIAEAYPPEVWERFKAAASEIISEYRARGWDRSSPGAEVLATEIMAKHGFTYSNRNS